MYTINYKLHETHNFKKYETFDQQIPSPTLMNRRKVCGWQQRGDLSTTQRLEFHCCALTVWSSDISQRGPWRNKTDGGKVHNVTSQLFLIFRRHGPPPKRVLMRMDYSTIGGSSGKDIWWVYVGEIGLVKLIIKFVSKSRPCFTPVSD